MLTDAMKRDPIFWTIESMCRDTSAFAAALGRLAIVSDYNNLALIQQTWPGTWAKHEINGKRLADERAAYLAELHANKLPDEMEAVR